jgi:hypothetical protein
MYNALDDLRKIGTAKAALALVPFLWHEDNDLASRAALNLATLLPKPDVENGLRGYLLTEEQRKAEWYKWVWEPFNEYEPDGLLLPFIVERISYLINQLPEQKVLTFEEISKLDPQVIMQLIEQESPKWEKIVEAVVAETQQPKEEFVKLKSILEDKDTTTPTLDDWKKVFLPSEYEFTKSWHFGVIIFLLLIVFLIGLVNAFKIDNLGNFMSIISICLISIIILKSIINNNLILQKLETLSYYEQAIKNIALRRLLLSIKKTGLFLFKREFYDTLNHLEFSTVLTFFIVIFSVGFPFAYSFAQSYLPFSWVILVLIVILLVKIGLRKHREAKNPLHGFLEPPKKSNAPTAKRRRLDCLFRWLKKR